MININSVRQMESFMEKAVTINRDSKSIYDLNIFSFIFRRQSLSTLGFGNMKMLNIVGGKGTERCNIRFVYNAARGKLTRIDYTFRKTATNFSRNKKKFHVWEKSYWADSSKSEIRPVIDYVNVSDRFKSLMTAMLSEIVKGKYHKMEGSGRK